jgi:hypothetical protein
VKPQLLKGFICTTIYTLAIKNGGKKPVQGARIDKDLSKNMGCPII